MSEPHNDVSCYELLIGTGLVLGLTLLIAAWCGASVECERQTCPEGQRPQLVRAYTDVLAPTCACVLR
jgi:hypothetical protein